MLITLLCFGVFILTGLLLSWCDEVKQRRQRRERISKRARRAVKFK